MWHAIDTFNPVAFFRIRKMLARLKPDMVQTHNLAGFSISAWLAAASLSIPITHVLHDYYLICVNSNMVHGDGKGRRGCRYCRLLRSPHRIASRLVSKVVGVSRFTLAKHLDSGLFRNAKSSVIYNSLEPHLMTEPRTEIHAQADGRLRVGFLGQVSDVKGVGFMLEAISRISSSLVSVQIAGRGRDEYIDRLKASYPKVDVVFHGRVVANDFLREQVDVLCVPSAWEEPFGKVVIEAFSHGIPVIGSRAGGIQELVRDNENGFLVSPGDPDSIYEAVMKFVTNHHLCVEMRQDCLEQCACLMLSNYSRRGSPWQLRIRSNDAEAY